MTIYPHMDGSPNVREWPKRGLPVFNGGPQDQPGRIRSLGCAIAWSFDLLPDAEIPGLFSSTS
ncbi:MAG: hypothetical protein KC438_14920 [Thermomicrobiales bacterium]|nr:hypothetical protein [Thermomicrobiales bacterium]